MLPQIAFLLAAMAAGHCCVLPQHNTSCPDFTRPAVEVPNVETMDDVRTSVKLHNISDLLKRIEATHAEAKRELEKWQTWRGKSSAPATVAAAMTVYFTAPLVVVTMLA